MVVTGDTCRELYAALNQEESTREVSNDCSNLRQVLIVLARWCLLRASRQSEILAMMNYETKSKDSLKSLKAPVPAAERREGIAIIDVDPASPAFGKIVTDIPLPAESRRGITIFYNKDLNKAYVTPSQVRASCHRHEEAALYTIRVETPGCWCSRTSCSPLDNKTFT